MPPPIQEVLLDLDVVISHILHEIRPTIPETVPLPPASNPALESEYISSVLTPLILQVIANDIAPVLPTCTYPDGSSFYLNDATDPNPASTIVDPNELLTSVLDSSLDSLMMNADEHTRAALESLDAADVIQNLLIEDANGNQAVEVIITGHTTTAEGEWTSDSGSLIGETVGVDQALAGEID